MTKKNIKISGLTAKAMLREKFTILNAYIKKEVMSKVNCLLIYLNKPENQKHSKFNVSRRKEMIKLRPEISKIKNNI